MFTVSSEFMGSFKLGDNINHNLKTLGYLYQLQGEPNNRSAWLLRKPIIITIASMCEAALYDLHFRMRTYTNEGVQGVASSVLEYVRGKKIDKFELYIPSAKKHCLLGHKDDDIYGELDTLRRLRNRIHIQNEKNDFESNDSQAFSAARQTLSEKVMERLFKMMASDHPRPEGASGFVNDFELPWAEHFPAHGG